MKIRQGSLSHYNKHQTLNIQKVVPSLYAATQTTLIPPKKKIKVAGMGHDRDIESASKLQKRDRRDTHEAEEQSPPPVAP
mmetsp:Transcript_7182/g.18603  ORF Transcript_7182/g.18603 Transcript_7182/m.18603 type:complete len:80 (+) Transcript_7182:783-1022(+)